MKNDAAVYDDDATTIPMAEDIARTRAMLSDAQANLKKSSDRLIPVVARRSDPNLAAVKP